MSMSGEGHPLFICLQLYTYSCIISCEHLNLFPLINGFRVICVSDTLILLALITERKHRDFSLPNNNSPLFPQSYSYYLPINTWPAWWLMSTIIIFILSEASYLVRSYDYVNIRTLSLNYLSIPKRLLFTS